MAVVFTKSCRAERDAITDFGRFGGKKRVNSFSGFSSYVFTNGLGILAFNLRPLDGRPTTAAFFKGGGPIEPASVSSLPVEIKRFESVGTGIFGVRNIPSSLE